ncbi:CPBP family intramembrane glutamic endopeptidase [Salinigranum halophilum]|uniref:CPBP family intramembrane glutamic endopeptidase n=1 Tax=Salinigranum halophilum TaxID=2565931 RepID=UPI00115F461E|nr:CPBP family intramembrane glutamic endopeptidase [Salinigranum halophilum]
MSQPSTPVASSPFTPTPSASVERRRVLVFSVLAFGIAWAVGGVIALTGGLRDSPPLVAGLSLGTVLLATGYMFAPAAAHVLTRLMTGEGVADARAVLRPNLRSAPRSYLLAWVGPAALTLAGVGLYFAVFPSRFDPTLSTISSVLPADAPLSPTLVVGTQLVAALTVGPAINTVFAFGEEFGWRGYLLPKLLPLGPRIAVGLVGLVWGVWHWPVIAMGYNYGVGYPGAPWTGMLAMVVMTVSTGTFLAWVTLRAKSVWPAALGHGAVNAVGGIGLVVSRPAESLLLGPTVTGLVVVIPWGFLAGWLLLRPERLWGRAGVRDAR